MYYVGPSPLSCPLFIMLSVIMLHATVRELRGGFSSWIAFKFSEDHRMAVLSASCGRRSARFARPASRLPSTRGAQEQSLRSRTGSSRGAAHKQC